MRRACSGPAVRLRIGGFCPPEGSLHRDDGVSGNGDVIARVFAVPVVTEKEGTGHLYAEKGGYSRFGAYATHAGIVIVSHRRVWIRAVPGPDGKLAVAAAGIANRNRPAFEKAFASVLAQVRADSSRTEKEKFA